MISIEKTNEHFRLIYDAKGRFAVHRIRPEEAKYKLCKVGWCGGVWLIVRFYWNGWVVVVA